ncbi:hypothetical protein [Blautia massiliensis (ex Liu et al. 2021)]|uniref:hypothetical protein n=1 Tax=Blautia massiliensis (ex Liu et al. 2021) TaxID=3062492 RepID=UPI003F8A6513
MFNKEVRTYAKEKGIYLWEIAEALHINDGNFSRRLRKELPEAQKQEIIRIIDKLAEKRTVVK